MKKTADGWRVAGGTLFEEFVALIPPKTGENTAIYALIFTLAILPLAVLGLYGRKKRRTV
jgi:LPXTG-motif cell wall-anchored protein